MHATITTFTGDPDELARRYDAMLADIPLDSVRLHLCLRSDDGLTVVDTCPTREDYERFYGSGAFKTLLERHGMPEPSSFADHPVHAAITDGTPVPA
jgi:hypothetical protein